MKKLARALTAAIILALSWVFPSYASISNPDSVSLMPIGVQVVRSTISAGDMTICIPYNIAYASLPTESAADAIMFRLYATDGTTLLASQMPYAFFNRGWREGVVSFYFTAAQMTTLGITYGSALTINIVGSPAYYSAFTPFNYRLGTSNYSSVTDQAGNRSKLSAWVIAVAKTLESDYSVTLEGPSDTGAIILSGTGGTYFQGAIQGLTSMAPALYFTQQYVPSPTPIAYNRNLADQYKLRMSQSDMARGASAIGSHAGVDGQFVAGFFWCGLAALALILVNRKLGDIHAGFLAAGMVMTVGALLVGDSMLVLRIVMAFIAALLLVFMLTLRRT